MGTSVTIFSLPENVRYSPLFRGRGPEEPVTSIGSPNLVQLKESYFYELSIDSIINNCGSQRGTEHNVQSTSPVFKCPSNFEQLNLLEDQGSNE